MAAMARPAISKMLIATILMDFRFAASYEVIMCVKGPHADQEPGNRTRASLVKAV